MKKAKVIELSLENLIDRQDFLIVQGNDLAKSLGGLKSFELRVLDYCFSYVTKESSVNDMYTAYAIDIIKHFGLVNSGNNYERIAEAFRRLNENTALYLPIVRQDGTNGIRMTQLFSMIEFYADGEISFKFSEDAAPYIIDLKEKFYSFRLGEISHIKGKYALILMKLWGAYRYNKNKITIIKGDLEEWEGWFLEKEKRLPAGRFAANVLARAITELENKFDITTQLVTIKDRKVVIGYELTIIDNRINDR